MDYPIINKCSDGRLLIENLSKEALSIIEKILKAYDEGKIDFIDPRTEDGDPDYNGEYKLVINDPTYKTTGVELLVMKWVEDREATDYLINVMED